MRKTLAPLAVKFSAHFKKKDTAHLQTVSLINIQKHFFGNYTISVSVDDFIVELIIDIVSGSDSPEKKASKTS